MTALAIGGQVLGMMAGIAGARTQAAAAKFQGQVDAVNAINEARAYEFNAKVAEQQAENTRQVARSEARDFRRAGSAALASRRAAKGGAAGVVASSGSPLLVDEKILQEIEFGAARTVNKGDIIATRLLNEAKLLKAHAGQANRNAIYARKGGQIAAKAASLGAYSSIAQGAEGIGNTLITTGKFG